jgi:H+/Cl- antiporter ClcA
VAASVVYSSVNCRSPPVAVIMAQNQPSAAPGDSPPSSYYSAKLERKKSLRHVAEMRFDDQTGRYSLHNRHVLRSPKNRGTPQAKRDRFLFSSSNSEDDGFLSPSTGLRSGNMGAASDRPLGSHSKRPRREKSNFIIDEVSTNKLDYSDNASRTERCKLLVLNLIHHIDRSWFLLSLLGLTTALLAWLVDEASAVLHRTHLESAKLVEKYSSWFVSYLLYVGWTVCGTIVGIAFTQTVHPDSRGSGISQMKCILQGFTERGLLGWRMLVAKTVGLILAKGSTLNVGSEGPFVIIAGSLATLLVDAPFNGLRVLRENPMLRRDILAAAAAAGVAATFGAPIGGVLFSIEVTSSYFMVSAYWKGFFCATCGAVLFQQLGVFSHDRDNSVSLFTTSFEPLPYNFVEYIPFAIVSVLCGVLGGFYVRLQRYILKATSKETIWGVTPTVFKWVPKYAVLGIFVAFFTASIEYPFGSFMGIGLKHAIDDLFHEGGLDEKQVTHADDWASGSINMNLFFFIVFKFFFSACNCILPLPYGVVIPVFAVGSGIGRLFGEVLRDFGYSTIVAGGYAVVGAASFTAGVTHTVSIAVIVFELTAQLSYMLPVLLGALLSRGVASLIAPSIFTEMSTRLNLPADPKLGREVMYDTAVIALADEDPPFLVRRIQLGHILHALDERDEELQWAIVDDSATMVLIGVVSCKELREAIHVYKRQLREGLEGCKETPSSGVDAQLLSHTVDLVSSGIVDLDFSQARVRAEDPLSNVLLHFSVTSDPLVFVTHHGRLAGVVRSQSLMQTMPLWYDIQKDALGGAGRSYSELKNISTEDDDFPGKESSEGSPKASLL